MKVEALCFINALLLLACKGHPLEPSSGTCHGEACTKEVLSDERRNLTLAIVVRYPEEKLTGQQLYVRGNGLGLNWQSGLPLTKTSADTWKIALNYRSRFDGFLCECCQDPTLLVASQKFEYRILIGDTQDMVGANFAIELPISKSAWREIPEFQVFPWFFELHGTARTYTVSSNYIGKEVEVSLYLPPSFGENPYKSYGAALVYDLSLPFLELIKEDVFDKHMGVSGIAEETILVGWGSYVTQEERTNYLTPVPGASWACVSGGFENYCNNCYPANATGDEFFQAMLNGCGYLYEEGGQGDAGLDFLIKEALPKAVELTGNRILTNREHIGIMGYSLGGLMACYAAWTRPEALGFASCQSSSFYWPMTLSAQMDFLFHNVTLKDPELLGKRKPQRIYIDVGSLEEGPPFYMDTAALEAAERMSATDFFTLDENVWFHFFPGHPHSNLQGMQRIWSAFSALIPPKGTSTTIAVLSKVI